MSVFGIVIYEVLMFSLVEYDVLFGEVIGVEVCSWKKEVGLVLVIDCVKEVFFC